MSLNGINAGYAATAATAIERFRKQIRQQLLLKNPLTNPKPVLPTKQPSVLLLNGQKMPHWLPS